MKLYLRANIEKQNRITWDTIWLTCLSHYSLLAASAFTCTSLFSVEYVSWYTSVDPESACQIGGSTETVESVEWAAEVH